MFRCPPPTTELGVATPAGTTLTARDLPALLERVHAALEARRSSIDGLNVFPVPDGDTGTNMTLTMRASLDALHEAGRPSPRDAARAVVRGAVGGARGNSGVILSQVVRAVVEALGGRRRVDATLYARALAHARDLAYEAVAEPVEGTILTVIGAAAEAAQAAVDDGDDLVATSARTCAATALAVEATPDQLDVLREAGVVDAGARGFEVVLAAVHGLLTGEEPPVRTDAPAAAITRSGDGCHHSSEHPFEVQYLLNAPDKAAADLRHALEELGDSVVVAAAGGLLNVHVHTRSVGPAIEAGIEVGRPSAIRVVHLDEPALSHNRVGLVAVLDGSGAVSLGRSAGAVVVEGAGGALPAVSDLLDAIVRSGSRRVLVLPGHRNGVAAAHQAARLADAEGTADVAVIEEAASPPAVLAGLAVFDPDVPAVELVAEIRAVAGSVRAGEVVAAMRDADTPAGSVAAGQPLAVLADGTVVDTGEDPVAVLGALCVALDAASGELVTLLVGADVDDAERDHAARVVAECAGSAEVELVDAGQHTSRYWIGVE
jgi:uncharacterized protein